MTEHVAVGISRHAPPAIAAAGALACYPFLELFAAQIRNTHTQRPYTRAVGDFMAWLQARSLGDARELNSFMIVTTVEDLQRPCPPPTVKQQLAAIRRMLDLLATGGVLAFNTATAACGPRHSVKKGKTSMLAPDEARQPLDSIDVARLSVCAIVP